jgi:hypothetical protein
MATALSLITGALLNINSYSPGETLQPADAQVGLNALNDLLDSLSNDEAFVYTQQETIYSWIAGQFQYSVGNPVSVNTFTGTVTGGSPNITGVTSFPPDLTLNGTVTDFGAAFPAGTTIVNFVGTTVTLSSAALFTPAGNPDVFNYTVPGNIPIPRPLRFRSGFTRANSSGSANQDYTFTFTDLDNYKRYLLKNVLGPWPYVASYQPTFPYGTLYVYPAPGASYTAHIFSDLILSEFASTTAQYSLPPGYTRALKKLLALELAPAYGKAPSAELRVQAKDAYNLIKGTNQTPVPVMEFDSAIVRAQSNDASWAQHGGFQ